MSDLGCVDLSSEWTDYAFELFTLLSCLVEASKKFIWGDAL